MVTFFVCLVLLIVGFFTYSKLVEKIFRIDDRPTPAVAHPDGVDYVPMKTWRIFLVQLLNIAGLGPIYGALSGACWGPVVYLWIVFGTILGGGVHDFLSGMMSERNDGKSISEVVGLYMGKVITFIMRVFSVVLLVMVGVNFSVGPAGLLAKLTPDMLGTMFWLVVIMVYYLIATFLPIDKIIGKLYPVFGICLIIMALGIGGAIVLTRGSDMPELTAAAFTVVHPDSLPKWSMMFVTVACGAISGFHSLVGSGTTAKQLNNEKDAQPIAYGGMLIECVLAIVSLCAVAYIWQDYKAGTTVTPTVVFATGLSQMLGKIFGSGAVSVTYTLMVLAVSVFCLTSLDTATRLARYMFQEFWLKPGEKAGDATVTGARKVLCNPYVSTAITVVLGIALGMTGYAKIWPLFGAANQLLAGLGLLAVAAWLGKMGRNNKMFYFPMIFMILVTLTSLVFTIKSQITAIIAGGTGLAWCYIRAILAILLVILAIDLVIEGSKALAAQAKAKKAENA